MDYGIFLCSKGELPRSDGFWRVVPAPRPWGSKRPWKDIAWRCVSEVCISLGPLKCWTCQSCGILAKESRKQGMEPAQEREKQVLNSKAEMVVVKISQQKVPGQVLVEVWYVSHTRQPVYWKRFMGEGEQTVLSEWGHEKEIVTDRMTERQREWERRCRNVERDLLKKGAHVAWENKQVIATVDMCRLWWELSV